MRNEIAVRGAAVGDAEGICAIYNEAMAEGGSTFETAPRSAADFLAHIYNSRFPLLVEVAEERVFDWAGLAPTASASVTLASPRQALTSTPARESEA